MKARKLLPANLAASLLLGATVARAAVLYTPLVVFDGTNGSTPAGALVQGNDGLLYGTASAGGINGATGTVFRLALDGTQFTNLYIFTGTSNGSDPVGGLVLGADGAFYGTTWAGGVSNCGTVFRITSDGSLTTLASFLNTNGASPDTPLTPVGDGSFYGGAAYGGSSTESSIGGVGFGVTFKVTTNGALSIPIFFARTNGSSPSQLVRMPDGNFYGATTWGGDTSHLMQGFGTLYRLAPDGSWTTIYNFSGGADGGFIYGGIAPASDGTLYGVTFNGGARSLGSLFQCTTNGQLTTLYAFAGGADGAEPAGPLQQASDGNLYGTTYAGAAGFGTLFQFTPAGVGTTLVIFTGTGGSFPGSHARTQLLQASDGNFYGVTQTGGAYNLGVLFRLSVPMPSRLLSISPSNGLLSSAWSSVAGQNYQVQVSTNLASGWSNFGSPFAATNGTIQISESIGTDAQRFYRIALLP